MASPPYSHQRRSLRAGLPRSATGLIPEGTAAPVSGGVGFGATPSLPFDGDDRATSASRRSFVDTNARLVHKTGRERLNPPVRADAPRCLRRCIPSLITPSIRRSADSPAFPEEGELAPCTAQVNQALFPHQIVRIVRTDKSRLRTAFSCRFVRIRPTQSPVSLSEVTHSPST